MPASIAWHPDSPHSRILIVDAMAMLYRVHFAMSSAKYTRPHKGFETNALLGTAQGLINVMLFVNASHVAVGMDLPGKTFRHDLLDTYKAHRPPAPEALAQQFPLLPRLFKALGVTSYGVPGYEADDVIATMAAQTNELGFEVYVFSGDNDFLQISDVATIVRRDGVGYELLDSTHVKNRTGVRADQYGDYLAMVGDSSDNYPGLPGIGKVLASRLLKSFGSMEGILAALPVADEFPERAKKGFTDRAAVQRSVDLAHLCRDVPLSLGDYSTLRYKGFNSMDVTSLREDFGFHQLAERIESIREP